MRQLLSLVAALCIAAVLLWTLFLARRALLTVYVSVILAIGFSPLVRLIEQQRLRPVGARVPRWVAILSIYVLILSVVGGAAIILLPIVLTQARELLAEAPQLVARAQAVFTDYGIILPALTFESIVQQVPASSTVASTVLLTTIDLLGGVFGIVAILGLTFYLLVESGTLCDALMRLVPRRHRPAARAAAVEITTKVSTWLTMQGALALLIGFSTAVGLWLLGIPYAYALALLAGLGELIPFVGPIVAAIPGIVVAATVSWPLALAAGAFYLVQQQIENHLLVPTLMGNRLGVSAAMVIVALLIGGSLLGVLGIILAIPTVAVMQVVLQHAFDDR